MRFTTHKRKRTPSVIIVALIDVLLVVLIFLMVTTTAKKSESLLKLSLPTASESKPGATENKPLIIQVATTFPYLFVGDRAVTEDKLQGELAAAVKQNPQLAVTVRGDKNSPLGETVKVINACISAKVGSINVVTDKPSQPQ